MLVKEDCVSSVARVGVGIRLLCFVRTVSECWIYVLIVNVPLYVFVTYFILCYSKLQRTSDVKHRPP